MNMFFFLLISCAHTHPNMCMYVLKPIMRVQLLLILSFILSEHCFQHTTKLNFLLFFFIACTLLNRMLVKYVTEH